MFSEKLEESWCSTGYHEFFALNDFSGGCSGMLAHLADVVSSLYLSQPADVNQIAVCTNPAGNGRGELSKEILNNSSIREGVN